MSTKSSIYSDQELHVYTDCLDEGPVWPVYIEVRTSHGQVTAVISRAAIAALIEHHLKVTADVTSNASATDEEIEARCKADVAERLRYNGEKGTVGSILRGAGWFWYGSPDDPADEQVRRGIESHKDHREKCRAALAISAVAAGAGETPEEA